MVSAPAAPAASGAKSRSQSGPGTPHGGERFGEDQRGGDRGAEQCPDGSGRGEQGPEFGRGVRGRPAAQPEGERDVGGGDRVLGTEADPARQRQGGHGQQPGQDARRHGRVDQPGGGRIEAGVSGHRADDQADRETGRGQHHDHPQRGVPADRERVGKGLPEHVLEPLREQADTEQDECRGHSDDQCGHDEEEQPVQGAGLGGSRGVGGHRLTIVRQKAHNPPMAVGMREDSGLHLT